MHKRGKNFFMIIRDYVFMKIIPLKFLLMDINVYIHWIFNYYLNMC